MMEASHCTNFGLGLLIVLGISRQVYEEKGKFRIFTSTGTGTSFTSTGEDVGCWMLSRISQKEMFTNPTSIL